MSTWTATNSEGYVAPAGLAADMVALTVIDGVLHVLVTDRTEEPFKGMVSLPGGFVGPTESAEDTVQRHLTAKTGVGDVYFEQLGLYSDPGRDPRGWIPAMAFMALLPSDARPSDSDARWEPVSGLPALAFDHGVMLDDALDRLIGKLWWSNVAVGVLPGEFTMSQARTVYSAITGKQYDPSTFARDLKKSGLIEETGSVLRGTGRPAALYRFRSRSLEWGAGRRRRA